MWDVVWEWRSGELGTGQGGELSPGSTPGLPVEQRVIKSTLFLHSHTDHLTLLLSIEHP